MTDKKSFNSEQIAHPRVIKSKAATKLSAIWLIPVIAALIGISLAFDYYSKLGPEITIIFETASELEAGKTKIRYKEVEIGKVEKVSLEYQEDKVLVTARLEKEAAVYLTEGTRFWVVRPRIRSREITGLGTIVSGVYIQMEPSQKGKAVYHFTGLEEPPLTPEDAPGLRLVLKAQRARSVDVGSPIYYRQIKVGQVESRRFAPQYSGVEFGVFINAPYHRLITERTLFWNVSGLDISLGSDGVKLNVESLESVIYGGITFTNIDPKNSGKPATNETVFVLHKNEDRAREMASRGGISERLTYLLHFEDSVRGLNAGAPVEFRGVRVGRVLDVGYKYNQAADDNRIPVLVEVELQRLTGAKYTNPQEAIAEAVAKGMRAQLQIGNFLTGQLFVELAFYPDAPMVEVLQNGPYPEMPTVPSRLKQITAGVSDLLVRVNALPFEALFADARKVLSSMDTLLASIKTQKIPRRMDQTLANSAAAAEEFRKLAIITGEQIEMIRKSIEKTLAKGGESLGALTPDSPLYYDLINTMRDLQKAAQGVQTLMDSLDQKPEQFLFGK